MKENPITTKEARITTKNISVIVLLKIIQYPFLFLFLVLVPRLMGPVNYGEYALLMSIITIAPALIDLGDAKELFGRFIPEFENQGKSAQIKRLFCSILALQSAISIVAAIILFPLLTAIYSDRFSNVYFILIIIILLVRNSSNVPYSLLFGLNQLSRFAAIFPIRRILSLSFIVVLFHYYGLVGTVISTLLVDFCLALLAFYWTREYFAIKYCRIDIEFLKPYLKYTFIFFVSWSLLNIWQRLGNILIEHFSGSAQEIAIFDIPNQIFLLITAFILVIISSLAPMFTQLSLQGQEEKIVKWSSLIAKYVGILCTLTFWGFAVTGDKLIIVTIGSDYDKSYYNGVVQLLGIFPLIITYLGVLFSIVYKKPEKYLLSIIYGLLVFIAISVFLIPGYSSMGCAVAALISYLVQSIVLFLSFKAKLALCIVDIFKSAALGFIFLPLLFINQSLPVILFLFSSVVLVYALLLLVTQVLNALELKEIIWALRSKPEQLRPDQL